MALPEILHKIDTDARKKAEEIVKKAEARAQEIEQEGLEKEKELEQAAQKYLQERKDTMSHKVETHIKTEAKMEEGTLKSQLLSMVLEQAVQKLSALPEKKQSEIATKMLQGISEKGTIFPAKGKKAFFEKLIQEQKSDLKVGSEAPISGGFLFEGARVDINASHKSIVENEIFPREESRISKVLFS